MKLKPCPFCGGEAKLVEASLAAKVVCIGCGAETGYHYDFGPDLAKNAIEHWNTRVAERTLREAEDEINRLHGELYESYRAAARAWNTRIERTCKDATSEEHTQAFTCSECGCWVAYDEYWETGIYVQGEGQVVHIHPRYCPNCGAKVVE